MTKLMIIAGETSGDLHGGELLRELKALEPGLEAFGIGGERMKAEGMELMYHVRELSFMGFAEVLGHLPFIRSVMRKLEDLLFRRRPDAVVLIDYPGFNLRFARKAHRAGIPVIYYISPQVWAWGRGRVRTIRRVVDKMLCILPFEPDFYRQYGVEAVYVGNPLLDTARPDLSRQEFYARCGFPASAPVLGLLPGSRSQEIERILPVMLQAAGMLKGQNPELQFALALAPHVDRDSITEKIENYGLDVKLVENAPYDVMAHSQVALVTSGTATLETAIIGTPMCILYKTSWFSYLIGRLLVQVKFIGLVNLVAGKKIIPEFIQHEARPGAIFLMAQVLMAKGRPRQAVKAELARIPQILGEPGAAKRAAGEILQCLKEQNRNQSDVGNV
jgi:lipid-A-disaccharide synthase